MREFDSDRTLSRLERLSRWALCVFSAACVEVLAPAYRRFCEIEEVGDPAAITGLLEFVWDQLAESEVDWNSSRAPASDSLLPLIPNQDEEWNEWSAPAENCVTAAVLLVDLYSTGQPELAARAAQQAYEAVDWIQSSQLDISFMDAETEHEVLASEAVQSELSRQDDALEALAHAPLMYAGTLMNLRREARARAVA
ncbi:DUF416 family protein [Streptomyces sp. NPDC050149]|uniref:DUF416 family protein n=1 Tax=Streptomyces sp. NPDC050149 TaxID=3365603 RepID=UPI00378C0C9C